MRINTQLSYHSGVFPAPRPGVFSSVDNVRARTQHLIAPNDAGVILMDWLGGKGKSGNVRAREILDQFVENPHSGVIWGITDYLRKNPTGNIGVDSLFQSEIFDALGIEIGVGNLKNFLQHIVMISETASK